ncbi:MAG: MFS transporter, partial [Myxococcales bacterium]|nr:MFS transporter [Myxococcales bacterium]
WCYGGSYFCIKLIRYSLLFWLPYYLSKKLNYDALTASDVASAFEAGGIGGVIVIGLLSDRVRMTRSALSAISLLGLAGALLLYAGLGTSNVTTNVAVLALVGAMLYGPDSLLSGAAAQDAGGPHAAATAAGFVNGLGSVGAAAQGFVTATVSEHYGWQKLFWVFVALAVVGAVALVPTMGRPEERRG